MSAPTRLLDSSTPKIAMALGYRAEEGAPRVLASGTGYLAQEIVKRAQAAGIPVAQSEELSALLGNVEINEEIPPHLYRAVAEVLVWALALNNHTKT